MTRDMINQLPTSLRSDTLWPGWADQAIILPIPESSWPLPAAGITVDGIPLDPKRELHVTVVGTTLGRELRASVREPRLTRLLRARFESLDWHWSRSGRLLSLHRTESVDGAFRSVHSIIELVELPAMVPFHRALGRLLGRELPLPPAHVTLYTTPGHGGIGVARPSQLRGYRVREVAVAELGTSDPRI